MIDATEILCTTCRGDNVPRSFLGLPMDRLNIANKVCGGCCAISLNRVEYSVSPNGCQAHIVSPLHL